MSFDPFQALLITTWLGLAGAGIYLYANAPAQIDPPEQVTIETTP